MVVFLLQKKAMLFDIGYLLAFKINREEMFKIKKAGLMPLCISEDFRKIGTGEGLVKECFNWFKENEY